MGALIDQPKLSRAREGREGNTPCIHPCRHSRSGLRLRLRSSIHSFVALELLFFLSCGGLDADLLVVLLEGRQILTRLGELTLLHTLAHIPVDEGAFGVHEVELVVHSREDLADGSRVGYHATRSHHFCEVPARDDCGRLVVDAALEAGGAPVDELDGALGLHRRNGRIHVLGHHITTVHEAAGHVLAVAGVALGHHAGGLERAVGDLSY
mmetsp:Transcript_22052/g.62863  ORF Transcript_22052/g.62863 Transcript_22052/m.62863 type:complete len:210 (-) Transcript_22052:957-1586(-)